LVALIIIVEDLHPLYTKQKMKITAIALCLSLFIDKHNGATQDPNGATQ
jgi:hypothetical protein